MKGRHPCRDCDGELILGENWVPSRAKSNSYVCTPCAKARNATKADERRAKSRAYQERTRERRIANSRAYYLANRERLLEAVKARYEITGPRPRTPELKAYYAEMASRRRAQVKAQTPPGADREAIRTIYRFAQHLTALTGTAYHVDHVTPLARGGLHHQDNLCVMRWDLNLSKHAREWSALKRFLSGDDQ